MARRWRLRGRRDWLLAQLVAVLVAAVAGRAGAQQTGGQIVGRVSDAATEAPLPGLTVVANGPQGEDAALTDERGEYRLSALPVGTYEIKVYAVGTTAAAERPGVRVSADKTVRVNLRVARPDQKIETYIIERRAPAVDLGTAHTGLTLGADYLSNVPLGTTYGDALDRAPGAFVDRSGSVSVGGASGLENVYMLDGMNVTGIELGEILTSRPNASGGSNLPLPFVEELSVQSGGYAAEYGGAMGGVVNVVTRSGSNEYRGSAFSLVAPSWLDADPTRVARARSALVGQHSPGYDFQAGAEVGGPILRNRLFFWAGLAPRRESGGFVRDVQALVDADGNGVADLDAGGEPLTSLVQSNRAGEWRQSYAFGGKLTYLPQPEHRLNLSLFGNPTSSRFAYDRTAGDAEAAADLRWPMQNLTKNNTDLVASWIGHFRDRRWKVEYTAGLHDERYRERSPEAELGGLNQVEWHGTNLYEREAIEACRPEMRGTASWDPCPVDLYRTGGFGQLRAYSAQRWSSDLKSTHFLSGWGSHELKYGARGELSILNQTRSYSGPAGSRALVQHFPGTTSVWSFFSLPRGRYPFQFSDGAPGDLDPARNGSPAELADVLYQDELEARVKNLSAAVFLQDSYSPLPNLTINVGSRFEHQLLYDHQGEPFANLSNLAFRGGVIYDPSNEGRAKLFGHYGRFFEAVPLNLAVRYFGGEGILVRNYDNTACPSPPGSWSGKGEWSSCALQPQNPPASSPYGLYNNGSNYPVQPKLRGQYHDEIVTGASYEVIDGLVVGLEFVHRWLGAVLEDGTAADGTFVLANPGRVSPEALGTVRQEIEGKQAQLDGAAAGDKPLLEAELGALQSKLANLEGLAGQPEPQRTYDALTLSRLPPPRPPPAGAWLVHLFAPLRQLQRPLRRRQQLLGTQRQQRLGHARPRAQQDRPAGQRSPPLGPPGRLLQPAGRPGRAGLRPQLLRLLRRSPQPRLGADPGAAARVPAPARLGRPHPDGQPARRPPRLPPGALPPGEHRALGGALQPARPPHPPARRRQLHLRHGRRHRAGARRATSPTPRTSATSPSPSTPTTAAPPPTSPPSTAASACASATERQPDLGGRAAARVFVFEPMFELTPPGLAVPGHRCAEITRAGPQPSLRHLGARTRSPPVAPTSRRNVRFHKVRFQHVIAWL